MNRSSRWLIAGLLLAALSLIGVASASETARKPVRRARPAGAFRVERSLRAPVETRVSLEYAQSGEIWATYREIEASRESLADVSRALDDKFGTFEEVFTRLGVSVDGVTPLVRAGGFRSMSLSIHGEALGSGKVLNPVVPEIHLNVIAAGVLELAQETRPSRSNPWRLRAGLSLGYGPEQRSDAISTDIIEELSVRRGSLIFGGFELSADRAFRLRGGWNLGLSGALRETYFSSSTEGTAAAITETDTFFSHRWRLRGAVDQQGMGAELIAGQQPLPFDILPRSWDYVHRTLLLPEWSTLLGGGLFWRTGSPGAEGALDLRAGFYGGYPGAGVRYARTGWSLTAGTWGIESSAAYHALGQRLWQASVGIYL